MSDTPPSNPSLHPLEIFYEKDGRPLPLAEALDPATVPPPYQALLVHEKDLTPTMESHYQDQIHLNRIHTLHEGSFYAREVALELNRDNRPVVYGVNLIHLDQFPEACREIILEGRIPLGSIMGEHLPGHYSRPTGYFRVESNTSMQEAFGQALLPRLYGRTNEIFNADGTIISEVVEILAPIID